MNIFKTSALTSALLMVPVAFAIAGDPVTLNITGNVVASPCQISSDSVSKSVDLGQQIQASSLQAAGSSTDWVSFNVNLDSCPNGTTKATMTMHGTADTYNPADMYKSSGTASNVAVQLQSKAGDKLGDGKTITQNISNNAATYQLQARAYTQNGSVSAGTIVSVVTATFEYQ